MKLHVISDTHIEFMQPQDVGYLIASLKKLQSVPETYSSFLVIAGDFCQVPFNEPAFKQAMAQLCSSYKHVIYVPGNHEYYGSDPGTVDAWFRKMMVAPEFHNLRILLNGVTELDGQVFYGGTMWFPNKSTTHAKKYMNDFFKIKDLEPWVYGEHQNFIDVVLNDAKPTDIVITHHTPFVESISPRFRGSLINHFFCADIEKHIKNMPKVWIHGHTHDAFDYIKTIGDQSCRVICNPFGYPFEHSNVNFLNQIVIDV